MLTPTLDRLETANKQRAAMEVEDKSRHAFTKLVEQSKNSPLLLYKLSFSQMCSQACKQPQLFPLSFYVYAVGIIMHSSNNALHVYH